MHINHAIPVINNSHILVKVILVVMLTLKGTIIEIIDTYFKHCKLVFIVNKSLQFQKEQAYDRHQHEAYDHLCNPIVNKSL